jgi:hypothetical protein
MGISGKFRLKQAHFPVQNSGRFIAPSMNDGARRVDFGCLTVVSQTWCRPGQLLLPLPSGKTHFDVSPDTEAADSGLGVHLDGVDAL